MKYSSSRGSALFIILIAVVLFGALSYAVANMMRSDAGDDLSDEKAKLYANEIMDYARSMREAVQHLRISNGCSDTDVSFKNDSASGYGSSTNTDCQVFHPDGGGMSWTEPNPAIDSNGWLINAVHCYNEIGTTGSCTSSNADLTLDLLFVPKNVCIALNDFLGVSNPSGNPPTANYGAVSGSKFVGSYSGSHVTISGQMKDKPSGCYQDSVGTWSGNYFFYQVLIAR